MSATDPRSPAPDAAQSVPAAIERLAARDATAVVTFAGQGNDPLAGLRVLLEQYPGVRASLEAESGALADLIAAPEAQASGRYTRGLDVASWIADPSEAPPAEYLSSAAISYPLTCVFQGLLWRALWDEGLDQATASGSIRAVAGHSQGLLAALMISEGGTRGVDDVLLARYVKLAWGVGFHASSMSTGSVESSPLAAISDIPVDMLRKLVDEQNADVRHDERIAIALVHGPNRAVVGGPPASLAGLRTRLQAIRDAGKALRAEGRTPPAPRWGSVAVDVPFHTDAMQQARSALEDWVLREPDLLPDPGALALEVLSGIDGTPLTTASDVLRAVTGQQVSDVVRWDVVTQKIAGLSPTWVLDMGPGMFLARVTEEGLGAGNIGVLGLASPDGRRRLLTDAA